MIVEQAEEETAAAAELSTSAVMALMGSALKRLKGEEQVARRACGEVLQNQSGRCP